MKLSLKAMAGRLAPFVIQPHDCPILMYHRVLPHDSSTRSLDGNIVVTPEIFESNLLFLLKYYSIVSLSDTIMGMRTSRPSCVLTFDDGWIDTYEIVFPILKRLGLPATVFLPTGFIGTNRLFWYDRIEQLVHHWGNESQLDAARKHCSTFFAPKSLFNGHTLAELFYETVHSLKSHHPSDIESRLNQAEEETFGKPQPTSAQRTLMDWNEVRSMGTAGITFGSHGVNHSILPTLSYAEQKNEITESRHTLLSQQINFVDCISFPNGNYNQDTLNLSEGAGYKLFVSASIRPCGTGTSSRLAHRIGVPFHMAKDERLLNYAIVKAKCSGRLHQLPSGSQ